MSLLDSLSRKKADRDGRNAFGDWRYVTSEDIATFHGERNRRLAMSGQGESRISLPGK